MLALWVEMLPWVGHPRVLKGAHGTDWNLDISAGKNSGGGMCQESGPPKK